MGKNNKNQTTCFGFRTVGKDQKSLMVDNVFHTVAKKYDLMNDLMSFGIHRIWKHVMIQYSGVRRGYQVIDLAGGTGDLTAKFSRLVGEQGKVVLVDINDSMLTIGRNKLRNKGMIHNIIYVQADAERLPFPDNSFDCISIAFGLRNITDQERALRSMCRVLKPGGRILILEFYMPKFKPLEKIYHFYSFYVLPKVGEIIVGDASSYRYLVESIRTHPDQETIASMMRNTGLNHVEYFNMSGGIVALHRGYKF